MDSPPQEEDMRMESFQGCSHQLKKVMNECDRLRIPITHFILFLSKTNFVEFVLSNLYETLGFQSFCVNDLQILM